jgi:hypothetical protein
MAETGSPAASALLPVRHSQVADRERRAIPEPCSAGGIAFGRLRMGPLDRRETSLEREEEVPELDGRARSRLCWSACAATAR